MTPLYTPESARRSRLRARGGLMAACALVAAAWTACALLCARVRTANAALMFRWVMGLSVLSGWAAIVLWRAVYRPAQAETRHADSILHDAGKAEEYEGALTVLPGEFQIPRGIRVRKARLDTQDGPVSLRLNARHARRLPGGRPVRVRTVRQYITAFEVLNEND